MNSNLKEIKVQETQANKENRELQMSIPSVNPADIAGVRIFRSTLSPMSATVVAVNANEKPLFVVQTDISFSDAEAVVAMFKQEYNLAD